MTVLALISLRFVNSLDRESYFINSEMQLKFKSYILLLCVKTNQYMNIQHIP